MSDRPVSSEPLTAEEALHRVAVPNCPWRAHAGFTAKTDAEYHRQFIGHLERLGFTVAARSATPSSARTADRPSLREAIEALTSEDEIAHGEAWDDIRKMGLGFCAYCDDDWPCRTQRGIDRLLAALRQALEGEDR